MPRPTPDEPPQLDLFAHSRDVVLRNDALDALARRDAEAADRARQALADEAPGAPALPALAMLVAALRTAQADTAPLPDTAALAAARAQLAGQVVPAALTQWGDRDGTAWLRPFWRQLAQRAAALPYDPALSDEHAAPLWLQAGDAAAAAETAGRIPSWWRIPAPLAWMARARCAQDGLDTTWPLLAELAWLAPPRLVATARDIADPLLTRLLRRFDDQFDPGDGAPAADDPAWFPAWLLTEQPALLPRLREARPGADSAPERAFRLTVHLLGLERQGRHHDLMAARQRLRDQQPALYAAYMRTR